MNSTGKPTECIRPIRKCINAIIRMHNRVCIEQLRDYIVNKNQCQCQFVYTIQTIQNASYDFVYIKQVTGLFIPLILPVACKLQQRTTQN